MTDIASLVDSIRQDSSLNVSLSPLLERHFVSINDENCVLKNTIRVMQWNVLAQGRVMYDIR